MKIFLNLAAIAALCLPACAQTAAVPAITIPARVIPAQTVTFIAKNGGKESFTIPAQTLPAQTTAPVTAPVTLGPLTLNFSCTGPDMQHLSCSAVKQ